jgi:hypothetical protein
MNTKTTATDALAQRETPLPGDVAVCAGCGGKLYKLSRNFYEPCSFCGSRKPKRNPIRPQVCRRCATTHCRLIPQGKTVCKDLVTPRKRVSEARLATAGAGLDHTCSECQSWPTPCTDKRGSAMACKDFIPVSAVLRAALAQCNPGEKDMKAKKNTPVTLLYVSPSTATWMKGEAKKINERHGGNVGLATIARAVLNGLCESRLDLGSCRGELDINDMVRKLVSATGAEVKS